MTDVSTAPNTAPEPWPDDPASDDGRAVAAPGTTARAEPAATVLARIEPAGWTSLDSRIAPDEPRIVIDHLSIGPGGIFVIDSHALSSSGADVSVISDPELPVKLAAAKAAADAIRALLPPLTRQCVVSVLTYEDPNPMTMSRGPVQICTTSMLPQVLDARRNVLTAGEVADVIATLEAGLRPAGAAGRRSRPQSAPAPAPTSRDTDDPPARSRAGKPAERRSRRFLGRKSAHPPIDPPSADPAPSSAALSPTAPPPPYVPPEEPAQAPPAEPTALSSTDPTPADAPPEEPAQAPPAEPTALSSTDPTPADAPPEEPAQAPPAEPTALSSTDPTPADAPPEEPAQAPPAEPTALSSTDPTPADAPPEEPAQAPPAEPTALSSTDPTPADAPPEEPAQAPPAEPTALSSTDPTPADAPPEEPAQAPLDQRTVTIADHDDPALLDYVRHLADTRAAKHIDPSAEHDAAEPAVNPDPPEKPVDEAAPLGGLGYDPALGYDTPFIPEPPTGDLPAPTSAPLAPTDDPSAPPSATPTSAATERTPAKGFDPADKPSWEELSLDDLRSESASSTAGLNQLQRKDASELPTPPAPTRPTRLPGARRKAPSKAWHRIVPSRAVAPAGRHDEAGGAETPDVVAAGAVGTVTPQTVEIEAPPVVQPAFGSDLESSTIEQQDRVQPKAPAEPLPTDNATVTVVEEALERRRQSDVETRAPGPLPTPPQPNNEAGSVVRVLPPESPVPAGEPLSTVAEPVGSDAGLEVAVSRWKAARLGTRNNTSADPDLDDAAVEAVSSGTSRKQSVAAAPNADVPQGLSRRGRSMYAAMNGGSGTADDIEAKSESKPRRKVVRKLLALIVVGALVVLSSMHYTEISAWVSDHVHIPSFGQSDDDPRPDGKSPQKAKSDQAPDGKAGDKSTPDKDADGGAQR